MAKKASRRRSRFAEDAALQALVRYEPEESGLKALAQQARADYGVGVRQATTTGDLTLQAAREAIPSVSRIYDQAGLDQAKTASLVSPELQALSGPGAGILQRGGALEVAQQLGNLRSAKAAALEDLNTRAVAARQGQQFGVLQARQKFQSDMQKILGQSQSLQRQKGAFTASTIGSMTEAALGRELSARNSARSARTSAANSRRSAETTRRGQDLSHADRVAARKAAAAKAGKTTLPGGVKLNAPSMHGRVADQVTQLEGWIRENKGHYKSRAEMAHDLLNGVQPTQIMDPKTGKPAIDPKTGQKLTDPGVPKAPSALALSAALDLAFLGGVSNGTARRFHERGYSVSKLGLKSSGNLDQRRKLRAAARGATTGFSARPPRV